MLNIIKKLYLLRLLLFWLLAFLFHRILFILYFSLVFPVNIPNDYLYAFFYGLHLDISAASYLMVFPVFAWLISLFVDFNFRKVSYLYHALIIPLVVIVDLSSILLFREWGTTLNKRALEYLSQPTEAFANSSGHPIFLYSLITIVLIIAEVFLLKKLIGKSYSADYTKRIKIVFSIAFPILLFIGIRGSIFQMPISESSAYYSSNLFSNKLASNKVWHIMNDCMKPEIDESKYTFYSKAEVQTRLKELTASSGSQLNILKNTRPNIVFIIVESFTYGTIDTIGEYGELCPNIKKMMGKGIFFNRIYSSGHRSDQGIGSLFSGIPAQPEGSVVKNPDKYAGLPSFTNILKKEGYSSQFLYGGEANFYNIKAFLLSQGVDKIIDKYDFSLNKRTIKLGVNDSDLFERVLLECRNSSMPMLTTIFTQSTHTPLDTKVSRLSNNASRNEKFAAMMKYTDKCIGSFIEKASKEVWYNNTLFVIVADHGDREFRNYPWNSHQICHIPLVLFGNVIKPEYQGLKINKAGGHHDVPKTLLNQMNLSASDFIFSKNLLDTVQPGFAYWAAYSCEGWITDTSKVIIDLSDKTALTNDSTFGSETIKKNSLSYMQSIVQFFSNKRK
ncbi:MAG: sulfatase-like hydrolase/transferase [Bacteroidota bacterium]